MNFNKTVLSLLLACSSTFVFAQTSNLRKAKTNIAKYEELKSVGNAELGKNNLMDAKEAIDKAIEHDKTKDLAETWTYAALIESNIALSDNDEAAGTKALEAIQKAKELDKDEKNAENISVAGQIMGQYKFNQGVAAWDKQDFQSAYNSFNGALDYLPGDTTLIYYSGLAAIQNQDYDNAIEKYKEILPIKEFSQHRTVTVDLSKLYLSKQDTANALVYAQKATEEYPDDQDAAIQNIELNLIAGNESKIITDIENQISKDPQNKNLYYYLGIAYSAADNPEKALESYRKAIEIDPEYLEANTNAAVTIMNSVRDELNAVNADKSLSNEQYNAKVEEIKEKVKVAHPFLIKVTELDPSSADALRNLKSYYDFMQEEEKSNEIQAKIDALN